MESALADPSLLARAVPKPLRHAHGIRELIRCKAPIVRYLYGRNFSAITNYGFLGPPRPGMYIRFAHRCDWLDTLSGQADSRPVAP